MNSWFNSGVLGWKIITVKSLHLLKRLFRTRTYQHTRLFLDDSLDNDHLIKKEIQYIPYDAQQQIDIISFCDSTKSGKLLH